MKKFLLSALTGLFLTFEAAAQPSWTVNLPGGETLQATACADNIFRIRIAPSGAFPETLMERYGILKTDWEGPECISLNREKTLLIQTGTHSLRIDKTDGSVTLLDHSGAVIAGPVCFAPAGSGLSHKLCEAIMSKYVDLHVRRNSPIIGDDAGW